MKKSKDLTFSKETGMNQMSIEQWILSFLGKRAELRSIFDDALMFVTSIM